MSVSPKTPIGGILIIMYQKSSDIAASPPVNIYMSGYCSDTSNHRVISFAEPQSFVHRKYMPWHSTSYSLP